MAFGTIARERPKNPVILSEILQTVRRLENEGKEPTFNTILYELSSKRILEFHRTLRKYLDLLVFAKLLTVKFERTAQPNIREKQVYHTNPEHNQPIIEAGEKALLLHGLNWDIASPMSLNVKTDLQGLALAIISGGKVYASLEDAIVQSLKVLTKRHPERAPELIVFATALLATQKVDFNYLLNRAKEEGVTNEILGILLEIDKTLASAHPNVEDIRTLYELRKRYYHTRRPLLKSIQGIEITNKQNLPTNIVTSNEIVEYAGKQLGIRG
jgi:hypothetical protein